jgi:hypothetical protein
MLRGKLRKVGFMTQKIRQIIKHGTWLYGGATKSDVWIVRQNYFEGPEVTDDLRGDPEYPPHDADGCFYFPEYRIPGAGMGSGGEVVGSAEEAIFLAEKILKNGISWDEISN